MIIIMNRKKDEIVKRHFGWILMFVLIGMAVSAADGTTTAPTVEKSFWEEVADFYSDNNNMAMYCVLPILVLVYGGCSAIYCIHKCRRYIRRRRHKRKHPDTESLVAEDERNDLNQEGGESLSGSERQPIKTVSANNNWGESTATFADVNGYNVQRKKTPLPWNAPEEIQRNDSFVKENIRSRETNYSAGSRESSANVLEREREKLNNNNNKMEEPPPNNLREDAQTAARVEDEERRPPLTTNTTTTTTYMTPSAPPPPPPRPPTSITKINEVSQHQHQHHHSNNARPIEIVPISRKEYQQRMVESGGTNWDPLHQRPFESRAGGGGGETERRGGRESAWSIREEIMAKYDALTSLAMAKKTADVLRYNTENVNLDHCPSPGGGAGHCPDTLRRKPGGGKKKLIFIAE